MNNSIRRPNFFIVGAPKCGTTSLAAWLSEHPQVFMSPQKEPGHFNTDFNWRATPDRKAYENLFAFAEPKHAVIGEATTDYLYSSDAIINILDYEPSARVLAMVRNPVDMVISFHGMEVLSGTEDVEDLEQAWRLQSDRAKGHSIPPLCRRPESLQYGTVCCLGKQMERMFDFVPPEQRHVVVLDDLKNDPREEWKKILRFLKADDDGRTQFPVKNAAKKNRYKHVRIATLTVAHVKEATGLPRFRLGILKRINSINRREQPNAPISPELRAELREYFRDDIGLLGELLQRDFSEWLTLGDGSQKEGG